MKILTGKEIDAIILGSAFLGAGGGGSPKQGYQFKKEIEKCYKKPKIEKLTNIPDDATVVTSGGMGSPLFHLKYGANTHQKIAVDALEEYIGRKIDYIIPSEIGGGNSVGPLYVATTKDIPIIDADGAGRAIPEINMTMYGIDNISFDPFVLASKDGKIVILKIKDPAKSEKLARIITNHFDMMAGFATSVMSGKEVKQVAIEGTVTLARRVGEIILDNHLIIKEKVDKIKEITGGYGLIEGIVKKVETKSIEGFDFSRVVIDGARDSKCLKKNKLVIDIKNESIIARAENNELVAMAPDLICILNSNGYPVTNADIQEGLGVYVVGIMSPKKWRRPKAYNVFKNILFKFGYDSGYVPIENLQR